MADARSRSPSPPPVPPPSDPPASGAGGADPPNGASPGDTPTARRKARAAVTQTERNLEVLRARRIAMSKQLDAIRKETKEAKRRISNLNKKASKTSLRELLQISLLKYQALKAKGELDESEMVVDPTATSSGSDAPSSMAAFTVLARTHAATERQAIAAADP